MAETGWLDVDAQTLDLPRQDEIRGVQINLLVSPYDVPQAVRGYYDKSKQRFTIELRYIGDEPKRRQSHPPLVLRVGKNSRRLYAIEVDVHAIQAKAVALKVQVAELVSDAIQHLASSGAERRDNYNLARQVISERQDQLINEPCAT